MARTNDPASRPLSGPQTALLWESWEQRDAVYAFARDHGMSISGLARQAVTDYMSAVAAQESVLGSAINLGNPIVAGQQGEIGMERYFVSPIGVPDSSTRVEWAIFDRESKIVTASGATDDFVDCYEDERWARCVCFGLNYGPGAKEAREANKQPIVSSAVMDDLGTNN